MYKNDYITFYAYILHFRIAPMSFFLYHSCGNYYLHFHNQKVRNVMFRLWGKLFKDNRLLQDTVYENSSNDTRTHKIFQGLDEICYQFDLGKPIWLDSNVSEFKRHKKTRFSADNFVESIDFDYLEIHIIDED